MAGTPTGRSEKGRKKRTAGVRQLCERDVFMRPLFSPCRTMEDALKRQAPAAMDALKKEAGSGPSPPSTPPSAGPSSPSWLPVALEAGIPGAVVLLILLVVLVLVLRRRQRQRRIARIWQEHITGNSEAAPAFVDARRPLTTGFLDAPSVQ